MNHNKHTAAILFSDIEESSRMNKMQSLKFKEVEKEILIALMKKIASDSILYFDHLGDGYLFLIKTPTDAVKAALFLRDSFKKCNWSQHGLPDDINIRCSLHIGEIDICEYESPITDGEKIKSLVGENIVVSARIEPVTPPSRIWATEEFKNLLINPPSGVEIVDIGVRQLAKKWGARKLYDIKWKSDESFSDESSLSNEFIDEKYLPMTLEKKGNCISFPECGKIVQINKVMDSKLWSQKIHKMENFIIAENIETNISDIGIAVGIQNFIYDGTKLFIGVRTKSNIDGNGTGFSLAKGGFNTGYLAFRFSSEEKGEKGAIHFPDKLNEPQDLFQVQTQNLTKKFVEVDSDIDNKLIKNKAGKHRCLIKVDGIVRVGLIFINKSKYYPRFEIGICKYIDISSAVTGDYIAPFGVDRYEESNYWIWVNDGVIEFRSIFDTTYIPCIKENDEITNKKEILIRNKLLKTSHPVLE